MEKYFNKKLYTDVQSWKVIELDEVKGAQPFKVYRRKDGVWYKKNKVGYSIDKRGVNKSDLVIADDEILEEDEFSYHFIKVTKTGKPRTCYTKFGEMSNECRYYYDYNF